MVRLGKYIKLHGGGTPSKSNESYWGGEIPWASVKDFKSDYLDSTVDSITQKGVDNSATRIISEGTLLIATRMAVGKVAFPKMDLAINQDLKAIECDENLNKKFLFYLLRSKGNYFDRVSSGATVKGIKINHITDMDVNLPPLETQKKIASILDAADAYHQKTKALIEKYDELTQSLFLEMFGDPVTNPKEWKKRALSEFIKCLNTGVSVNSTDREYEDGDLGILKTSCVYTGIFRPTEAKVIRDDEYERMKLNPTIDSIIVSRMNTTELVGKSAYIANDYPNLFLPDRLWQTEKGELPHNVKWLSQAVSFQSFMNEIGKISSGTSGSMKNISKKNYLNLPMIYPSIDLQNQFEKRIQEIEDQKAQAQRSLAQAEELFKSLLQRAFKGELV